MTFVCVNAVWSQTIHASSGSSYPSLINKYSVINNNKNNIFVFLMKDNPSNRNSMVLFLLQCEPHISYQQLIVKYID